MKSNRRSQTDAGTSRFIRSELGFREVAAASIAAFEWWSTENCANARIIGKLETISQTPRIVRSCSIGQALLISDPKVSAMPILSRHMTHALHLACA